MIALWSVEAPRPEALGDSLTRALSPRSVATAGAALWHKKHALRSRGAVFVAAPAVVAMATAACLSRALCASGGNALEPSRARRLVPAVKSGQVCFSALETLALPRWCVSWNVAYRDQLGRPAVDCMRSSESYFSVRQSANVFLWCTIMTRPLGWVIFMNIDRLVIIIIDDCSC